MSVNPDAQLHEMECIRIDQTGNRDLEFEFACTVCGYDVVLPLFEVLARGDIEVSHADSEHGLKSILITLHERDTELPQCFRAFLGALEDDEYES